MKQFKIILLLLCSLFFMTGCYDKTELDNYAYVIGIGLDVNNKSGDDGEKSDVSITYQIAIPVKIAGEDNSSGKETYTTYTVEAPSLLMGNSIVNTMTSKEVNLSHINIILYSEEIAKKGLTGHINGLLSNPEIRPKTPVAICKGRAEDFFNKVTPVLEANPSRYYSLILSSFNYTDETVGSELMSFYADAQSIDRETSTVIGEITTAQDSESGKEEDNAIFKGLAAFKGDKMVGEIDSKITDAHLLITNALTKGTITVEDAENSSEIATVTIKQHSPTKIKVKIEDNIPKVDISVFAAAHLESTNSTTDYLKDKNKIKLRTSIENKIKSNVYEYLNKIKELDSDIAGIGKYAKKNYLTWQEFEEVDWQEIFKNSEFKVTANVNLDISRIVFHKLPNQS